VGPRAVSKSRTIPGTPENGASQQLKNSNLNRYELWRVPRHPAVHLTIWKPPRAASAQSRVCGLTVASYRAPASILASGAISRDTVCRWF
jgi:hypothetical protein